MLKKKKTRKEDNIIKAHKEKLPINKKNIVLIYKLKCKNCTATYVGQTKRKPSTRINKHQKSYSNNRRNKPSVIDEHIMKLNREFDWDNAINIDNERYLSKRLVSEMCHIHLPKNDINFNQTQNFYTTHM